MLAIQIAELFVKVGAKLDEYEQGMTKAESRYAKAEKRMGEIGRKMTLAVSVPIVAALGFATKAYMEQESADAALQAALEGTGSYSEATAKRLGELAGQLQKTTIYADDATISAMAYGHNLGISADQLDDATRAAMGLAARYKMDLQSAMMLIGRASQGQTQMLARYGIVLDDTLSPQEKFNRLLEIGAGSFALAEAQARTGAGAIEQLKNLWGDFAENIGAVVLPYIKQLVEKGKQWVVWLQALPPETVKAAVGIAAFVAAVGPLLIVMGSARTGILAVVAAVKSLGAAYLWLAANPMVLVAAGIAALIAITFKLIKAHKEAKDRAVEQGIKTAEAQKEAADKARGLVLQYQALEQKTNRTAAEQAQMKAILAQLKALFPEVTDGATLYGNALSVIESKAANADKRLKGLMITQLERKKAQLEADIEGFQRAQDVGSKQKFWGIIPTTKGMRESLKTHSQDNEIKARLELAEVEGKLGALRGETGKKSVKASKAVVEATEEEKKAKEDLIAAEDLLWDIRHRNAGKLKQLEMERDKALEEAKGPKHSAAIEQDFADKKKALIREIQQAETAASNHVTALRLQHQGKVFEAERVMAEASFNERVAELHRLQKLGEDVTQRILEAKTIYGVALGEINKRELEEKQRIAESETQAAAETAAIRLRMAGQTYEAEIMEAQNAKNAQMRALLKLQKAGEDVTQRLLAVQTQYHYQAGEISKRRQEEQTRIEQENARKRIEAMRAEEQAKLTVWERITDMLLRAELNLIRMTQGETAARAEELKRQYEQEREYVEKSIKDAEKKAAIMAVLDADYEDRRDALFAEESKQQDQRVGWFDQIQRKAGFTDVVGQWKRIMETAANTPFGGLGMPQMQPAMGVPSAVSGVTNTSAATQLTEIKRLLTDANMQRTIGNTKLMDIGNTLKD